MKYIPTGVERYNYEIMKRLNKQAYLGNTYLVNSWKYDTILYHFTKTLLPGLAVDISHIGKKLPMASKTFFREGPKIPLGAPLALRGPDGLSQLIAFLL